MGKACASGDISLDSEETNTNPKQTGQRDFLDDQVLRLFG
jgi:hypothetical protein